MDVIEIKSTVLNLFLPLVILATGRKPSSIGIALLWILSLGHT